MFKIRCSRCGSDRVDVSEQKTRMGRSNRRKRYSRREFKSTVITCKDCGYRTMREVV